MLFFEINRIGCFVRRGIRIATRPVNVLSRVHGKGYKIVNFCRRLLFGD